MGFFKEVILNTPTRNLANAFKSAGTPATQPVSTVGDAPKLEDTAATADEQLKEQLRKRQGRAANIFAGNTGSTTDDSYGTAKTLLG